MLSIETSSETAGVSRQVAQHVHDGIYRAGGKPIEFGAFQCAGINPQRQKRKEVNIIML